MDRNQQMQIVTDLLHGLSHDVLTKINAGAIPEDWDGIELRQYLADKAAEQFPLRPMSPRRKKEYRNTVIVNNL